MKSEKLNNLLHELIKCVSACETCTSECLKEENVKMLANCIRLNMDCAEICSVTARFLARDSAHGKHLLDECMEICGLCAEECEKHEHSHCQECARICRECRDACAEFV